MITGDNPLTACHVAKELRFTKKPVTLLFKTACEGKWIWESINQSVKIPFDPKDYKSIVGKYDLCITGEVNITGNITISSIYLKYKILTFF